MEDGDESVLDQLEGPPDKPVKRVEAQQAMPHMRCSLAGPA